MPRRFSKLVAEPATNASTSSGVKPGACGSAVVLIGPLPTAPAFSSVFMRCNALARRSMLVVLSFSAFASAS